MKGLYRGISSQDFNSGVISRGQFPSSNPTNNQPFSAYTGLEYTGTNTLKLYDVSLVERNILNHINTEKGSRVMMSNFGTDIPRLLFEPLDEIVIEQIKIEIQKVVDYDPRVTLKDIVVTPLYDKNTIAVYLNLYYVELQITKDMNFNLSSTT